MQAISHLPVSIAAILAPEVSETGQVMDTLSPATVSSLNQSLYVLRRSQDLVVPTNFPSEQQVREEGILNR